jgi:hypothetical protein
VQKAHDNPWVGLLAVGFSPADRLAAIAAHLGWTGMVLADPQRLLYRRLGIGRAPWWRIYTLGTLAIYARALLRRQKLTRPEEDTHQLGGDAIMVAGTVTTVWRPTSPDDRPSANDVLAAARSAVEAQR